MSSGEKYRYPGTRPFETGEAELFFGRSDDSEQLFRQVLNEKTVLLYAKSGLGKSSLINAGLLPLLNRTAGYEILQVRFGNFNPQLGQYNKPLDILIAQIEANINPNASYLDKIIPSENSLWYRFKQRQWQDKEKNLLFIFDQFEELLTYPEEDIFHFKKQFAHLVFSAIPNNIRNVLDRKLEKDAQLLSKKELQLLYTPLRAKVLFAIRNDRMSDLNRISDYFPNILKTFYELKPLTRRQAKEAIELPAEKVGNYISEIFSFGPGLVNKIIRGLEDEDTHTIESFQLQMVCRFAEELIVKKETKAMSLVSEDELGNIQSIFAENYRRVLEGLPQEHQQKVQELIEEKLIVAGNRVPLPELVIKQQEGIPQDIIDRLLNSHLLRAERNSVGGLSIELSHDTLIAPVTEAYEKRKAAEKLRLQKEQAQAEAARKQKELDDAKREAEEQRKKADFAENYRRMLNGLPKEYRYIVQELIEERLIVAGKRVTLPELLIIQEEKIPKEIIDRLLDSNLLRARFNNVNGRSIELSNDILIAPVIEAYKIRKEKEQAEAEAARIQRENEVAKQEADLQRKRAEEQARLREEAEDARKKARRNLWIAGVVAAVAIIVAVFALYFNRQAKNAKEVADSSYKEVKKEQALNKASAIKSFADSYQDLHQDSIAMSNYQAAFDTIKAYPDLPIYRELQVKVTPKRKKQ